MEGGTVEFDDFATKKYSAVGKCIYCGATDNLTDEHIMPFGLSGPTKLPKSSCRECAKVTCRFEAQVLRGPMRGVRVYRQLASRSRHKGVPKTAPLRVIRGGVEEVVHLPFEEHPVLLAFPVFSLPALLDSEGYSHGVRMKGIASISFGRSPMAVRDALGVDDFRITQNYRIAEFARMIAKIAYSYAVAEGFVQIDAGLPPLTTAILGGTEDIGVYVGTFSDPLRREPGRLHTIGLHEDHERGLRYGSVKLFADAPTPHYGVMFEGGSLSE